MLNFVKIVELPSKVTTWMGPVFTQLVTFALNVVAVAVILLVAYRIALIGVQSIAEFRNSQDAGGNIVIGALKSILATVIAGSVGFLFAVKGIPWMLELGQVTLSSAATDPNAKTNAVGTFFKDMPFLKVIFDAIKTFASYGVIIIGGVLLAKTGVDALQQVKYEAGGGNSFTAVQTAIKRAAAITVLGVLAYAAVNIGPDIIFGYLNSMKSQLSGNLVQ